MVRFDHRYSCLIGRKKTELSLGKAKTRIKAGVTELQSLQGLKRVVVHFGIGFFVGTIVDLITAAIMLFVINPALGGEPNTRVYGFNIYPDEVDPDKGAYTHYDDVFLIIVMLFMIISRKLWFVVGFFAGWYTSGYMNLYGALGLPEPET